MLITSILLIINLHFSDKPSPPLDLSACDITSESATLNWSKPEDDGGSPITGYRIEKRVNVKNIRKYLLA